eukprot:3522310-Rhodomonas_salina.2
MTCHGPRVLSAPAETEPRHTSRKPDRIPEHGNPGCCVLDLGFAEPFSGRRGSGSRSTRRRAHLVHHHA